MRRAIRTLFLAGAGVLALVCAGPSRSDAVEVRPVVGRHYEGYYYAPRGGYYHAPRGGYYRHYPGRYYYHYGPGTRYYRYPHGYYDYHRYHPHGRVQIGPYGFELWH